MIRTISRLSCWALAGLLASGGTPRPSTHINQQAELFKEFSDRVKKYVKLQKSVEGKLRPLPEKAAAPTIAAHREALAKAIRAGRADARPGDIFFAEVQPLFKRIIQNNLHGPHGKDELKALRTGNPRIDGNPTEIHVSVNALYPSSEPLSTVPPGLLLSLPDLPEGINYRLIGRDLVLTDSKAALILDFIRGVIP